MIDKESFNYRGPLIALAGKGFSEVNFRSAKVN